MKTTDVLVIGGSAAGMVAALTGKSSWGLSAGELTNVIGLAIQDRMSVNSLLTSQIGTHPCLTASPAGYTTCGGCPGGNKPTLTDELTRLSYD